MTAVASDQITALRQGAAFCSPDQRFLVRVTGDDVLPWLERLLSMPVAEIGTGQLVRAVLMDGKGKMRMDLRVMAAGAPTDGLLLDLPLGDKATTLRLLDMYVITEDVTFTDLSTALRSASLIGPHAADVLRVAGIEPPDEGRVATPRDDVYVLPTMLAGLPGYDLFFDGSVGRDLVGSILAAGAVRAEPDALDVVRIAAGVPWFGPDLAGDVIPLEANLDDQVSIHKGCYPGQEVVARILNMGHVSRRLVRLAADGEHAVEPGSELSVEGGKVVGTLTSAAYDPSSGTTVAIGFVKRAAWDEGVTVTACDVAFTVRGNAVGGASPSDA